MQNEFYLEKLKTELKLNGYSNKTIESYLYFLNKFFNDIKNPENATLDQVKIFLSKQIDNYSKASQSLLISSIRFFYNYIIEKPEISTKIKTPKKEKKLPVVLTRQEIKNLIDATEFEKTKLIIKMLYSTGLRVSELVNLMPKDIDFNQKEGWVRKGKGSKDRSFNLNQDLSQELKNYLEKNPDNKYLFSRDKPLTARNIQLILKRLSKKANINKKISPHTLRHSFATHLLDRGENLMLIKDLLGHENLETTKIYTHISREQLKKVKTPLDDL